MSEPENPAKAGPERGRYFVVGENISVDGVHYTKRGHSASVWHVSWGAHRVGGSRLDRLKLKAAVFRYRLRDAWEVLRGRASID